MRIVNRATFLNMPAGTVYSTFEPLLFGPLAIKGDTRWHDGNDPARTDFLHQDINAPLALPPGVESSGHWLDVTDTSLTTGSSIPMDFDSTSRDGMFEADCLFAVWEPQDVRALILRLHQALTDATPEQTIGNTDEMPTGDAFIERFYSADLMTTNPWWMGQA